MKYDEAGAAVDHERPYLGAATHRIRILVVEGQPIVRDALVALLGLYDDFAVVGAVASLDDTAPSAAQTAADTS